VWGSRSLPALKKPCFFLLAFAPYFVHNRNNERRLMSRQRISIPRKKIGEFCRRWKVEEFSLFGSVLREDFRSDSDVDVLITFTPDAQVSLFDLVDMQNELEAIFKRNVDLVEKDALKNPFRKREIFNTAQVVYAA
jgi:uncharacterized protein